MPVCAVPTCATTHRATDKTLYKFPKDINYARIWVRCCKKKDSFNTKSAFICSLHFAEEAYQRDINRDILGSTSKKHLRKDAVPTLQLPSVRMFRKSILQSDQMADISFLSDIDPAISPKRFLKENFEFCISSPWKAKCRAKFNQTSKSYSSSKSSDVSHNVSLHVPAENDDLPDANDPVQSSDAETVNVNEFD